MYRKDSNYQTSLMSWTEPTTPRQKAYFSKHAPERKLFGWFLWALLGIWAIADFYGFQMLFTEHLPALEQFKNIVTVAILLVLHYSLYITAKTYWFATLDDGLAETAEEKAQAAKTDATPWIPITITLLMLFASREGSKALLQSMAPVATITTTTGADTDKAQKLESEKKALDHDLAAIEALYSEQIKAAEKPHRDAIARLTRSRNNTRWDDKARRSTLLTEIRKEEKLRDEAGTVLLAEKAVKQQNTMNRYESAVTLIQGSHTTAVKSIESVNERELEAEAQGKAAANRYSWLISVLLAGLFWGTCYRWVKINLKSGIRPKYEFTEFDKNGGSWALLKLAVGDAFKRQAFRFSVWVHTTLSTGARELPRMDGRVNFVDPDDGQDDDDFNGSPILPTDGKDNIRRLNGRPVPPSQSALNNSGSDAVITGHYKDYSPTVINSAQKEIMDIIITIRPEFSNFKNPDHKPITVWNRLERKFAKIDEIIARYTPELIGAPTIEAVNHERAKWMALENPNLKKAAI